MLISPCEIAVRKYIPSVRASIAIVLVRDFGMSVYRAAKLLGLSPAAISNYMLGRRGSEFVEAILGDDELYAKVQEIAKAFLRGDMDRREAAKSLCKICVRLREKLETETSLPECGGVA
jgi:hypothetical protein